MIAEETKEATKGMPSLFPDLFAAPVVIEHTIKAEHIVGKKSERRGRKRNYSEVKEMMALCRSITYVLKKDDVVVMALTCYTHRTAFEASKLATDLLKRRLANECTVKYEH